MSTTSLPARGARDYEIATGTSNFACHFPCAQAPGAGAAFHEALSTVAAPAPTHSSSSPCNQPASSQCGQCGPDIPWHISTSQVSTTRADRRRCTERAMPATCLLCWLSSAGLFKAGVLERRGGDEVRWCQQACSQNDCRVHPAGARVQHQCSRSCGRRHPGIPKQLQKIQSDVAGSWDDLEAPRQGWARSTLSKRAAGMRYEAFERPHLLKEVRQDVCECYMSLVTASLL